jgi:hypothetical protein
VARKHIDPDQDIWVKANNAGGDIEDIRFTISIFGEIIEFHTCLVVAHDKSVLTKVPLSIEPFINYLARNSRSDLDVNTRLFRSIIDGIKHACGNYYGGSFKIDIGWNSYGLDSKYFPSARKISIAPDGTKVIGLGIPKPRFAYPEPAFLLVTR